MRTIFSKLDLPEEDNFLMKPFSEESGEGYAITDDPMQQAAYFLSNGIPDGEGMIVIIRGDETAMVMQLDTIEPGSVAILDFKKRDFAEVGEVYRNQDLQNVGVLIDRGIDETGKYKLQIVSDRTYDPMWEG